MLPESHSMVEVQAMKVQNPHSPVVKAYPTIPKEFHPEIPLRSPYLNHTECLSCQAPLLPIAIRTFRIHIAEWITPGTESERGMGGKRSSGKTDTLRNFCVIF